MHLRTRARQYQHRTEPERSLINLEDSIRAGRSQVEPQKEQPTKDRKSLLWRNYVLKNSMKEYYPSQVNKRVERLQPKWVSTRVPDGLFCQLYRRKRQQHPHLVCTVLEALRLTISEAYCWFRHQSPALKQPRFHCASLRGPQSVYFSRHPGLPCWCRRWRPIDRQWRPKPTPLRAER